MDAVSETRLQMVHPVLARKMRQMADILAVGRPPVTIRITQGFRTWAEQSALYEQGRSTPGPIVSNAEPGHSYHQFGLAVDVAPIGADKMPDWNKDHPVWKRIVEVGTALGLTSGATFRSFPDFPHFQLTGKLPASPDTAVREAFGRVGLVGVWQSTGIGDKQV